MLENKVTTKPFTVLPASRAAETSSVVLYLLTHTHTPVLAMTPSTIGSMRTRASSHLPRIAAVSTKASIAAIVKTKASTKLTKASIAAIVKMKSNREE